ncbi:MAG: phosphate ABC transporter permease PstA [Nitrospinota bacterium]|nr:phosphate ABC transporter permease PstA [Nitrospinota bacterium]
MATQSDMEHPPRRSAHAPLSARGEPYVWLLGGALVGGVVMIIGFLALITYNGLKAFWPRPVAVITMADGARTAGEKVRTETYSLHSEKKSSAQGTRSLYRVGNFDLTGEDFKWVAEPDVKSIEAPEDIVLVERLEWGPFIGRLVSASAGEAITAASKLGESELQDLISQAHERRENIRRIQRGALGDVNRAMEAARLSLRWAAMEHGKDSKEYSAIEKENSSEAAKLESEYARLSAEAARLDAEDAVITFTMADVSGGEKTIRQSSVVRMYWPNAQGIFGKAGVYIARWWEFLTAEPREANTEGGVMPAIFGTFVMTVMMALLVAPFGVMAALYLREYARQNALVSLVRISVNNMAGVPSIVYGIFGLGFFAYGVGGWMDGWMYAERLPSPTFGTGGVLWASLTLALLTAPVVIVATEEALSAVPQSAREGSLACGASKWQTIRYIVLPKALPGIMTGLILAMARGAGEVAPLMLVGVVKLAPELPVDMVFPYVHLERSFMCLGFHIYDVGFQSRNAEAGKPMVFMTTLLLMSVVAALNAGAIIIRNRLKKKYVAGHF